MTIKFDDIQPQEMQAAFVPLMEEVVAAVHALGNPTAAVDTCPACDSRDLDFYTRAFGFDMTRCGDCGLIFCNPYPSREQLDTYYNSDLKTLENVYFRETFEQRIRIFLPRIELIRRYRDGGTLLDIGSAIGIFLESLRRVDAPFEVVCCDLSADACRELAGRFPDVRVIHDNVLTMDESKQYDVITLWDTIEHIADLHGLLRKVRRLCRDDGLFVFSTPNTDSFEWTIAGDRHLQLLPPGHVNLLNRDCIARLLTRNGFVLEDSFTLNASYDISYVRRLIADGQVDHGRLGAFLEQELSDPDFEALLTDYLIAKRKAGNILVVARPVV